MKFILSFLTSWLLATHSLAADRPNMVVFLSDDHTWRDSSVYGSPDVPTPNMQRLADAGMTFNQAFVASPSCAPSRAALLTGLYPARNGAEPNHSKPHAEIKKLPAYLQDAGYEVAAFGKVGHYRQTTEYGFDVAKHFGYHEDIAIDEAIRWLERRQNNKPLCLFVGTNWPHVPWPEETGNVDPAELAIPSNHVDTPKLRTWRARYVAAVERMDRDLGKVYDAARATLGDDIFFLHTTDHGAQWPFGKWNLYDDGIRTPLIATWPNRIAPASRSDALVSWIDILPTLIEVAGGTPPKNIDGRSFLSVLKGEQETHRETILTTHSGDGSFNVYPMRAARTADGWKYIRNLHPEFRYQSHVTKNTDDSGYWSSWVDAATTDRDARQKVRGYLMRPAEELYDTATDPDERVNLINEVAHVSRLNALRKQVDDWIQRTGDTLTVFGPPQKLPPHAKNPDWIGKEDNGSLPSNLFVNPIAEGADPWVVRDPNGERYLWCFSDGNRAISIHTSNTLTNVGEKHVVWRAPQSGSYSKEIWAPELHFLDGHWHIYFAASDGQNVNHLTYVLRSESSDPLSQYELLGPLATGEGENRDTPNVWAIDMTVLEQNGKRYAVWSGWDAPGTDRQYLYIAAMKSPTELTGPRVRLCDNDDYLWERTEPNLDARGLNEGPQVFQADGQTSIVYSCGASWLPTYKLGLLELTGDDPLDPASWKKRKKPLFESTSATYGVGHSSFVRSLDGQQWWHVFHAKRDREPGWRRAIFVQPMRVGPRGFPVLGKPVQAGNPLERPSGETAAAASAIPDTFAYYGHHQFYAIERAGESPIIRLGRVPAAPINGYRSGEKVVLAGEVPADFEAHATIDFLSKATSRDAGILFRCTAASVGYDAQRAYFAGLIPSTQLLVLGKTDGSNWTELARAETKIDVSKPQQLAVKMVDQQMTVTHNGDVQLQHSDATYANGTVGLRVVDTEAVFTEFDVN